MPAEKLPLGASAVGRTREAVRRCRCGRIDMGWRTVRFAPESALPAKPHRAI